jgi:hypothetical protein
MPKKKALITGNFTLIKNLSKSNEHVEEPSLRAPLKINM